jgi:hypothetical protein
MTANPADPIRPQKEVTHTDAPDQEASDEVSAATEFLQQVMNKTLAGYGSTRELNPQVYNALLEVARRHVGKPLSLDPVAIDLVAACLQVQLPLITARETLSRRMYTWIASSLLDDPAARQRLAELWARLGEAVA